MTARRSYAGIGSRKTPDKTKRLMRRTARHFYRQGWTQRTGGADGADEAFMSGLTIAARKTEYFELYLPWPGFNGFKEGRLSRPTSLALDIAANYHPYWERCSRGAKALLARDVHQVLGPECNDPVLMIVCWTPDGSIDGQSRKSGGTGMALRVAVGEAPDALIFNLARPNHLDHITRTLA